ncbi:hypothetical protein VCHA43P277_50053 [Vibrio chagasii]|nr:hypothetical protein VCHA34P115_20238 [Vibrio chagasii]CAH6890006.1 hypothetical protein VCHA34P116_20242 [Vibrio chagasii]CAH6894452.1 hypothetical protein VCHA32P90_20242 [Vibrio chagasii]CAH6895224.1 hypothetical protein VCHA35O137_20283 [Vibrio chagasii]CAH6899521.1 hypothetical protein VCHA34P126_20142 [Vibrio chagasii]
MKFWVEKLDFVSLVLADFPLFFRLSTSGGADPYNRLSACT